MTTQVDNSTYAVQRRHFLCDCLQRCFSVKPPFDLRPPQCSEHFLVLRYNLTRCPVQIFSCSKIRLCGCRKHHCRMIPTAQLVYRAERRCSQINRKALHFIEYNDAVCDIMKFTAVSRTIRKQRLEKSNRCGNDNRRTPSGGQFASLIRQIALAVINQNVRYNVFIGFSILLGQR